MNGLTKKNVCLVCFVLVLGIFPSIKSLCYTMQVFPASSRKDNTIYCITGELNKMAFYFMADNAKLPGKYPIKGLTKNDLDKKNFILSVDMPKSISYIGTVGHYKNTYQPVEKEEVSHNGMPYIRYQITIDKKLFISLFINGTRYYYNFLWFKPLYDIHSTIYWKLIEGEKVLCEANTKVITLGKIDDNIPLPKRFFVLLWHPDFSLSNDIMEERAFFYKRTGITHFNMLHYSKQAAWDGWYLLLAQKLKSAGIKILGDRSFREVYSEFSLFNRTIPTLKDKSLYYASKEICQRILKLNKKDFFPLTDGLADGELWDFEAYGPGRYPGYNDLETIKAFCLKKGLKKLTPEEVKSKYANEYYSYRMQLTAAPILAYAKKVKSVKTGTPVFMCHGTGFPVGGDIDLKYYDKTVDYLLPMIYTSPLSFYNKVRDTANYIGADKLIPTCFTSGTYLMQPGAPGELLMNYIGVASCGAAGLAHWPGVQYFDGGHFYDLYRGARMLAPVEDFYREGTLTKNIKVRGMPYMEKKIQIGPRIVNFLQPDWSGVLASKTHSYHGEILTTLLNYHASEDVYVEIKTDSFNKDQYLINRADSVYLTIGGKALISPADFSKGVMVKVPSFSPALWLITDKKDEINDLNAVAMEKIKREYRDKQKIYIQKQKLKIPIGKKGAFFINYAEAKNKKICLEVSSPKQKISFISSGGRIWKWVVNGKDIIEKGFEAGGAGKDLFWLPILGRWSGEQTSEMNLERVVNKGKEVILTYRGVQKKINMKIEKTYRIPADKSMVKVSIKITNVDMVSPEPAVISYWSHNYFGGQKTNPAGRVFMVATDKEVLTVAPQESSVFSNSLHMGKFSKYIIKSGSQANGINVFGEYFPQESLGILFRIPKDFLQIYRWEGDKHKATMEWMQSPKTLAYGESDEFSFKIEIFPSIKVENFKKKIRDKSLAAK